MKNKKEIIEIFFFFQKKEEGVSLLKTPLNRVVSGSLTKLVPTAHRLEPLLLS